MTTNVTAATVKGVTATVKGVTATVKGAADSGNRTQLIEGGGLRDIQETNGRCDLLPLDIVSDLLSHISSYDKNKLINIFNCSDVNETVSKILSCINDYIRQGITVSLLQAVTLFLPMQYCYRTVDEHNINNVIGETFATAILDLSTRYKEGAVKYGERDWEKGLPVSSCLDSGVRHLLKWYRQDSDENHASAFMWNMVAAMWMTKHKPECIGNVPFNAHTVEYTTQK